MKDYFAAELCALRQAAQEFAEQNPAQAGQLNINGVRDWDPYVERLLEGTAFLTAQIHERLDNDIPEICETLLTQLWPQILQPLPAMTILQLQPATNGLQQTEIIPENLRVQSLPSGEQEQKTICEFKTIQPVKFNPLKITAAAIADAIEGGSVISLTLASTTHADLNKLDLSKIVFYLHAETALALELYYVLTEGVTAMSVAFPEYPTLAAQRLIDGDVIAPAGFKHNDIQQNTVSRNCNGFQLLQEYFCFREKFLFVKLQHLEKIKLPDNSKQLEIKIQTKHRIINQAIAAHNFQLNCATAINLFAKSSEPIRLNKGQTEYRIVADSNNKNIILYSLDKVIGINTITGQKRDYVAFHSFQQHKTELPFYQLSARDDGHILALNNATQAETLSCEITCCNGNLPRLFLTENMLTIAPDIPAAMKITNILRPNPMYLPPARQNWRWMLIAHLAFNLQAIQDITGLQQVLRMYDWSGRVENQRRIEGITAISIKPVRRLEKGLLLAGLEFKLTLKEENYLSIADIYLFGKILHRFFAIYAPFNIYICTRIFCHPSAKEFLWQTPCPAN